MKVRDFLEMLDERQLQQAKQIVDERLAEMKAETLHLVWCVGDDYVDMKIFTKNAYVNAAEFLLQLAKEYDATNIHERNRTLTLKHALLPESKLGEHFSGEDLKVYLPDTA